MIRVNEPGWLKIPIRYRDPAERRGVWFRETPPAEPGRWIVAIEMCAGREGDDLYVELREHQTITSKDLYDLSQILGYGDTLRLYEQGTLDPGPRPADETVRKVLGDNAEQIREAQFRVSYPYADEPESLYCIGCGAESKEKSSYGGFTYPTCKEGCSWTALVAAANKCE